MPTALKKRNAVDLDTEAYQDFRGRSPKETIVYREAQLKRPLDMWAIGDLTGLWLVPVKGGDYPKNKWGKPTIIWTAAQGMKLAADRHEENRQLWIVGPKSYITEADLINLVESVGGAYNSETEFQCLGLLYGLAYECEKRMDEFQPRSYGHQLGEENGIVPTLWYHRPSKSLIITGGDYKIPGKDLMLGNSPGIVN